jgi:hypothetical protein
MANKRKNREMRTAPQVGIIFYFGNKLWIESTPLEKAGTYGECKIHDGNHIDYWDRLISEGLVPQDDEYQNIPRGRVVFNTSTKRYRLMLDRCILRRKSLVAAIKWQMGLPAKDTDTATDPHYRCAECLGERGLD